MSFSNADRIALVTRPNARLSADVPAAAGLADAGEETVATELTSAAGAISVHARLADLLDPAFRQWQCVVTGADFALEPGETVRLSHPRFGLLAGRSFILLAVEDSDDGTARLTLLGGKD